MSILTDFEDRFASAVEGLFAGAFRSPVQPAEIAKALAAAMDDERMVGIGKVYAPVAYSVALSPDDMDNLRGFAPLLSGELATYLVDHARERAYFLAAKPTVGFAEDGSLKLGRFLVAAEHIYEGAPGAEFPAGHEPARASVAPPEPVHMGDTVTIGETGHDVALRGDRIVVGRLTSCDIFLADANASRRHAEFLRIDDEWYVQDLESTNGTMVNGQKVDRARLNDGDVVEVGVTRLTYHRAQE